MSAQQKRRRDVLFVLLGLVAFTFFLAVLTRSMAFVALQLVADVALAGYVYLLAAVQAAGAGSAVEGALPRAGLPRAGAVHERAVRVDAQHGRRTSARSPPADRVELTATAV